MKVGGNLEEERGAGRREMEIEKMEMDGSGGVCTIPRSIFISGVNAVVFLIEYWFVVFRQIGS